MSTPRNTLIRWSLGWLLVVAAAGCEPGQRAEEPGGAEAGPPRASVTLRIAVVSDAALTRAIERLRGEWNTLTDGQVETVAVAEDADLAAAAEEADLIVFPSRRLGELCEAWALRPVRPNVLESDELRFADYLPLVRDHEVVYAQRVMALPLGCPTPLLLLSEGDGPAELIAPDDDMRLALAYLAWAAPHAVHRSRVATLFDADDFSPRLTAPPFERTLETFVDAIGAGPARFAWPDRDAVVDAAAPLEPRRLPGAEEVYNPLAEAWEAAEGDGRATLVASDGRLIGVTTASRNAATAFRYAAWLAGPDNAREVATASDHVANCRGSLARAGDAWRDAPDRELARAFGEAAADALRCRRLLMTPRLPGADEYLGALGKHVRHAMDGEPAAEALFQAAADWEGISQARGRETQAAAYLRSLNAADFPDAGR